MGVTLFERGRSGVRPTAAGELLLRHVRETQNEYQRTRAEIASLGGTVSGDVRIISLESLLVRFLPQVVDEISAKHPKVTFTVLSVHPSEIGEALRSGDNDFGVLFVDNRHRGVDVLAEFPTAVGALMRPDHPLATRKTLTLTECVGHPVVMLQDRWLLDAIMATEFANFGRPALAAHRFQLDRVHAPGDQVGAGHRLLHAGRLLGRDPPRRTGACAVWSSLAWRKAASASWYRAIAGSRPRLG